MEIWEQRCAPLKFSSCCCFLCLLSLMMRLLPPGPFVTTLFNLNYFKWNVSYLRSCKGEIISFVYIFMRFVIMTLLSLWLYFLRNVFVWWRCRTSRRWWWWATPPSKLIICYYFIPTPWRSSAASACLRRNGIAMLRSGRNWVLYITELLVALRPFGGVRLGKLVDAGNQRALLFEILLLFLVIFWWILHSEEEAVLCRFLTVRNVRILLSRVWLVAS